MKKKRKFWLLQMPVLSFLEEYDLAGKIIAPFCTHEGSGPGQSIADIRKTCPGATVMDGPALRGSEVKNAKAEVSSWLKKSGTGF